MDKNALRACVNYDPTKRLKATSAASTSRRASYLPLEDSLAWFHHFCMEKDIQGLIDDSELSYLADAGLLIGKASVFLNGELVGRSCGGVFYSAQQSCQTTVGQEIASVAKLRALENAGFGYEDARSHPDFLGGQEMDAVKDDIRACSYDPIPDMTFISGEEGTPPNPYLEVPFRMKWFHQWLKDNKATGYIDDSNIVYYPGPKLLVAKADVYINGKLVGTSCASKPFDPEDPAASEFNPVTYACTQAKGRALVNAGFGVLAMGQDDKLGENPLWDLVNGKANEPPKPKIPPLYKSDGVAQVTPPPKPEPDPQGENDETPPEQKEKKGGRRPKKAGEEPPKKQTKEKTATPEPPAPVTPTEEPAGQTDDQGMPREEALQFVIPIGEHKGKTVGETLGQDRGIINFYASDRFRTVKYADLKRAAIAALKEG